MAAKNFGHISGPFQANENILLKIQQQEETEITSLCKLGIQYAGDFDLDISWHTSDQQHKLYVPTQYVKINNMDFQIGKTRMLELEDCQITSIVFKNDTDDRWFIDYEY